MQEHGEGAALEAELAKRQKSLTIGAVCKALAQEFPDISISKIRYLEDQKLLTPRRTPGGYRLYTQADVARLRTILRLQRDEFLPLRVIRQELAAGRGAAGRSGPDMPPASGREGARTLAPERQRAPGRRRAVLDRRRARGDQGGGQARARARRVRRRQGRDARRRALLRRDRARDHRAPSPSSRATASAGATCGSSAPPPTARPTCCSRSSRPRCARATPSAAKRPSTRSRTSPPSPRTSSTCCSSATCARSSVSAE